MQTTTTVMNPVGLNEIKKAAMHLRAIDNPLRLKILDAIRENNNRVAVSQLYKKMKLVQSVASGQLAILRKSMIVTISREGEIHLLFGKPGKDRPDPQVITTIEWF